MHVGQEFTCLQREFLSFRADDNGDCKRGAAPCTDAHYSKKMSSRQDKYSFRAARIGDNILYIYYY